MLSKPHGFLKLEVLPIAATTVSRSSSFPREMGTPSHSPATVPRSLSSAIADPAIDAPIEQLL